MERNLNKEPIKEKNTKSTGIFFDKENLSPAGQIIQNFIRERTKH